MTTTDLRTRIENNENKILKKSTLIDKKIISIEKKTQELIALGVEDPENDDVYIYQNDVNWYQIYGLFSDISGLEEDVSRNDKQIIEIQNTIEKQKLQLSGKIDRESTFIKDIPECMKQMQVELIETWNKYDIEQSKYLRQKYEEIGYKDFFQEYSNASYELMNLSKEEINKQNEVAAKKLVIDLYYRVSEITGDVTDWSNIHYSQDALNGVVIGKEGRAKVQSIVAGGYNIQRLHIRVLVHSI